MGKSIFEKRIFNKKIILPDPSAGKIQLKHREIFLAKSTKAAAEHVVTKARYWMVYIGGVLGGPLDPFVKGIMRDTFKTPAGGPTPADVQTIRTKLATTLAGLAGDVTVKIAKDAEQEKGTITHGYVNRRYDLANKAGKTTFTDHDGDQFARGDITIRPKTLKGSRLEAIQTLIHEATHKYVNTWDHCYMNDTGTAFDGANSSITGVALTKDDCLENADSYAWFVVRVCEQRQVLGGADA